MSYNPRLKSTSNNTLSISGSVSVLGAGITGSVNIVASTVTASVVNIDSVDVAVNFGLSSKPLTSVKKSSANTTLGTNDYVVLVDCETGNKTIKLPLAEQNDGRQYVVKKSDISQYFSFVLPASKEIVLSGSLSQQANDSFGDSVAINSLGNRVAVGATYDESGSISATGLVYVYTSGTDGWKEEAMLSGSKSTAGSDRFGYSLAMNSVGNRIIVGAPYDEFDLAGSTGVAYLFVSGTDGWKETAVLTGSYASQTNDNFGFSVAMNASGDRVLVSALADETLISAATVGIVYMFVSGAAGWTEQNIFDSDLYSNRDQTSDQFGYSVSMNASGNIVFIGANRDEDPNNITGSGAVYIFNSASNGWSSPVIITGSNANGNNEGFGQSVCANEAGNIVVVGASSDVFGSYQGTAYVFNSSSSGWLETAILTGSKSTQTGDSFGYSVAINSTSDRIFVSALNDENSSPTNIGLVYMFASSSIGWTEVDIISGSYATGSADQFGNCLAINSSGNTIIVGASNDESGSISGTGLSYIYVRNNIEGANICILTSSYEKINLVADGNSTWYKI